MKVNTYKFDPPVPYLDYFPDHPDVAALSVHFVTVMDSSDHPLGDCCLQVNMGKGFDMYIDMPKYSLYMHHEVEL